MEERATKGKRPLIDADDLDPDHTPITERRARFPKGKKARRDGGRGLDEGEEETTEAFGSWMNPQLAAKERASRRTQLREAELFRGDERPAFDISAAEVHYEDDSDFEDDGIRIEPFNLKQEREEGYFDESGNFVEYERQHEIKDAWLDSVEIDSSLAEKMPEKNVVEEEYQELSSEDIAKLKRNIADVLQPGETILQALKRLKGTSSDKRGKMSEGIKRIFEQLTEDAMKLMENGDYNVYHEERETFEREAEGYELLVRARESTFGSAVNGSSGPKSMLSNGMGNGIGDPSVGDVAPGVSEANTSGLQVSSSDGGDGFDMFGEDDEPPSANPESDGKIIDSSSTSEQMSQPTSENLVPVRDLDSGAAGVGVESDYTYDPSSGYYYSSSLGYYYDPASGLYCCASSGQWYSFDEQTGSYVELQNAASAETEGA